MPWKAIKYLGFINGVEYKVGDIIPEELALQVNLYKIPHAEFIPDEKKEEPVKEEPKPEPKPKKVGLFKKKK